MTLNILFSADPDLWSVYSPLLTKAFSDKGLKVDLHRTCPPEQVDYIIYAPNDRLIDFSPFVRVKAVFSLWAGVESIVENPTLTQPLARMVDDGLTQGMVEWVTGHVLRHHLGMDQHILEQNGQWEPKAPPLSYTRPITILGMGELGTACAHALTALAFPVSGWSRRFRDVSGVYCHAGTDGLQAALNDAQIVVLLLPQTPQTESVLNEKTLAMLPKGAVVINPGRGGLIDDDALLKALDSGHIAHATLDVFRIEPLPADHAYWAHPKVTVTPHIASETRPDTAAHAIARNIAGVEAGQPLLNQVDRAQNY